ncbi:uncharacterized protein METZ01_LOCUS293479 [marine metagenome]|uniref:PpiC domain-containing protein n=1 Tax=marine metagenome TaxID=408172 RepID=A0A382LY37_9ZZZZ
MDFFNSSHAKKLRMMVIGLIAGALFSVSSASAETLFSVNGVDVDSAVVDLWFNSRLEGGQANPQQRELLIAQLRDIYILATQENAALLAQDGVVAAQLHLQRHNILAQAVANGILEGIDVTDDEISAEYDQQIQTAPPLDFKARHILVSSQGQAIDLIQQLDNGADFQELAKEKSIDTGSAANGGDLDWFSPNQMVAAFGAAVAALEDGSYSPNPVQTQFGWHVIFREDSRDAIPPTLEASKDSLRTVVQQRKFDEHVAELRAAATN